MTEEELWGDIIHAIRSAKLKLSTNAEHGHNMTCNFTPLEEILLGAVAFDDFVDWRGTPLKHMEHPNWYYLNKHCALNYICKACPEYNIIRILFT